MDTSGIIDSIRGRIKEPSYPAWSIGVTTRPEERKRMHGVEAKYWDAWPADSAGDAREVEMYFLAKGMRSCINGGCAPGRKAYVYIF